MPIYEFYCRGCHTVFNFFSRTVNTRKRPACPGCERPRLERQVSSFAISKGLSEPSKDTPGDLDEAQMERAMAELAQDADQINEDDPRQMARMMRKLYDVTGTEMGGSMEEAMRRLEAGENPDQIEEDMGDLLGEEDFLQQGGGSLKGIRQRLRPPAVDDTLHEM